MYEAVKYAAIHDQQNESSVEAEVITEGTSSVDDGNFLTVDKDVADATIPDKHNGEGAEDGVLPE